MFLDEILKLKTKRLEAAKAIRDYERLKHIAFEKRKLAKPHRLQEALKADRINIIAEIKRASPSKGNINDKVDVAETARIYKQSGASAISVLTEEDRFKGSLEDLKMARENTQLPILRKDFIFDQFQIYESAEAGADVILLIVAMLDNENLQNLYRLAESMGLDVLVETHNLVELERAKKIGAKIIGINNRNLKTFEVSLDVSRKLIKYSPNNALMICESGLSKKEELLEMKKLGFNGFLIGESLMKSENLEQTLVNLRTENAKNADIQ